jgi:hypothetical protein
MQRRLMVEWNAPRTVIDVQALVEAAGLRFAAELLREKPLRAVWQRPPANCLASSTSTW